VRAAPVLPSPALDATLRPTSNPSASHVVIDEGRGFDPGHPTHGFGLVSLRNRIESLGGRLEIDSVPEQGTTCRISLPLGAGSP